MHVYSINQYYKIQVHIHTLLQTQFIYPTCTCADQDQNLRINCLCHLTVIGEDETVIQLSCTHLAHNFVLTNVYTENTYKPGHDGLQ